MTLYEARLRVAHEDWERAMRDWVQAQENIRAAKAEWQTAQAEFFGFPEKGQGCPDCLRKIYNLVGAQGQCSVVQDSKVKSKEAAWPQQEHSVNLIQKSGKL